MAQAPQSPSIVPLTDETAPLRMAAQANGGLATIVGIGGGFSRALGAQLGSSEGETAGDLADHCLEQAIVAEIAAGGERRVLRFGAGSPFIDVRLPCGGSIDVLVDPTPDATVLRQAIARLEAREPCTLALPTASRAPINLVEAGKPADDGAFQRHYLPPLRLVVAGSGAEPLALARAARALGIAVDLLLVEGAQTPVEAAGLSLGARPELAIDRYTAIVGLFHDREWERTLVPWMLDSEAHYIGMLGSATTHARRCADLAAAGYGPDQIARIRAPIGLIDRCREPAALAVSILAEIVAGVTSGAAQG